MKRQRAAAPAFAPLFPYLGGQLAQGKLVIDCFAGWGGASTGIEAAIGRPVDHAINHDRMAVDMHRVNHPHSHHSVEDVWHVHPLDITNGQPVGLLWASPTCSHFSKAKGAALLDRKIRGLAWMVMPWVHYTQPDVIVVENVEEFQGWGPLTPEGRPDPKQTGRTFNSWVNALRVHGYAVEWRELRACDYGSPTIRKRLFVIARRDGLPIVWPDPTHAVATDPRVQAGVLKPYRTAAECIDWTLPCPSIFGRKKPLVRNTLNRVAQGLRRFVLESDRPFIVTANHGGEGFRGQPLDQPFNTIVAAHEAHGLTRPVLAPCVINKQHGNPARAADAPLSTVTTNTSKNEVAAAYLTKFNTGSTGQQVQDPIATITAGGTPARESTGNTHGLVAAHLTKFRNSSPGQSAAQPLDTVLAGGEHFGIVASHLVQHNGGSLPAPDASYPVDRPARTVLAQGGPQAIVSGYFVPRYGERDGQTPRAVDVQQPSPTVVTSGNGNRLTTAHLTAYYSRNGEGDHGQAVSEPLRTIPTVDRFGPVVTTCAVSLTDAQLERARQVHDFLLEFLGDALLPYSHGGLVVLQIRGEWYVLADIGMRMLTPRELASCQGFPETYELERTAEGQVVSKARQVRGIGNSVCPQVAEQIVRAQLGAQMQEAAD